MILDGVVVLFLIFSALMGYKKGLTTILISFIGFVIAIILAFMFKGSLADFAVKQTNVDVYMKQMITDGLNNAMQQSNNVDTSSNSFYSGLIKNMGVNETVDNMANNVTRFIIETAAFMIIYMAVTVCAFILKQLLNIVFDLPILSTINNFGGLGAGAIMGLFKIWVILAIASILVPMFGGIKSFIDSTVLTKMLYDTNLLVKLLSMGLNFKV
jgi:uncharacterized membrane protein required for colicin V production